MIIWFPFQGLKCKIICGELNLTQCSKGYCLVTKLKQGALLLEGQRNPIVTCNVELCQLSLLCLGCIKVTACVVYHCKCYLIESFKYKVQI